MNPHAQFMHVFVLGQTMDATSARRLETDDLLWAASRHLMETTIVFASLARTHKHRCWEGPH
jgi:hypothetical protein